MDLEELLVIALAFVVLGAPVLALSVRLAVKPVAEAVARLREAMNEEAAGASTRRLRDRVAALEEELDGLRSTVYRLEEAAAFRAELEEPGEDRGER